MVGRGTAEGYREGRSVMAVKRRATTNNSRVSDVFASAVGPDFRALVAEVLLLHLKWDMQ